MPDRSHAPPPDAGGSLLAETDALDAWRAYFETAQVLITRLGEQLRAETGSDLGEFNVLMNLAEAPDRRLTLSALARRLVFSIPRLSYRIDAMVDRGWVAKEPSPNDRRASEVLLTPGGLARLRDVGAVHREHLRQVFDEVLTQQEMHHLAAASEKISDRLCDPGICCPDGA